MSGTPAPSFLQMIVAAVVRHAATAFAGSLATWGVIQSDQQTEVVSLGISAGAWALSMIWSVYQKSQTKPKVTP
jgi:hypothetical protein